VEHHSNLDTISACWRVPKVIKLLADSPLFLIGLGIGFAIALIGGVIDYLLSLRKGNTQNKSHLPGCMLYVAGALSLLGIIALIVSLVLSGSISPAIILGAGVLSGFYAGFALLLIGYLVVQRFWPTIGR
jgi:protein-S-isoprenylcysteine O-methyltransferase Ste14